MALSDIAKRKLGTAMASTLEANEIASAIDTAPGALTAATTAYTQTYSTASHTHANITTTSPSNTLVLTGTGIAAATASLTLTDAVNTNAGTVATSLNQAQKDLGTAHNALRVEVAAVVADLLNVKQVLNSVIDDLQAKGLLS